MRDPIFAVFVVDWRTTEINSAKLKPKHTFSLLGTSIHQNYIAKSLHTAFPRKLDPSEIFGYIICGSLLTDNYMYSGTSDKGHNTKKKPPYKGHVFLLQTTTHPSIYKAKNSSPMVATIEGIHCNTYVASAR